MNTKTTTRATTTWVIPISIIISQASICWGIFLIEFSWWLGCFASFSALLTEGEQIIIPRTLTSEVLAAIQSVRFIAQHIKDSDRDNEVSRLRIDFGTEMSNHARTYDNFLPLDEADEDNLIFATHSLSRERERVTKSFFLESLDGK